jgi:hypothetical protein
MRPLAWLLLVGCSSAAVARAEPSVVAQPVEQLASDPTPPDAQATPLPGAFVAPPSNEALPAASPTLSADELEELGFGETTEQTLDTGLKIYGFADFTFSGGLMKKSNAWRSVFNRYPTFWVGNFNVYVSRNLTNSFRMMSEVRFTFLPNGNPSPEGSEFVKNTMAIDYADFNRPFRWGAIEIERLYLEWSLHHFVTARFGHFLTPYGIWNVDHGTPTFITTGKPYVIGNQLFPEHQTGIELYGRWEASSYGLLGYHLTLSNGTGPVSEYRDLDNNKAVGGRLYFQYRRLGDLKVGVSGYYGRDTDSTLVFGADTTLSHLTADENLVTQSDSLALAADVVWRHRGWHLQSEWISQQRRFTDRGRVQRVDLLTGRINYPVDTFAWGVYALAGYSFDWWGCMPHVLVQYFDQLDPTTSLATELIGYSLGLNFRPADEVVFKFVYFEGRFPNGHFVDKGALRLGQVQLAWAF